MAGEFYKVSVRAPRAWRNARNVVAEEVRVAVRRGADLALRILRNTIRLRGAVATRTLIDGAASRVVRQSGVTAWYTREVFFRGEAASYWEFVDKRRRAGKMPVEHVGTGPRGGQIFRPFEHVRRYLELKNVPRRRWFLALRAMARGFRGHHFVAESVRQARPLVRALLEEAVAGMRRRLGGR